MVDNTKGSKRLLAKDLSRVGIIVVIFIAAALFFQNETVKEHFLDVEKMRGLLHPEGASLLSYLVFILVGSLLVGAGMPRIWLSFIGGAIYGVLLGTVLSLVTTMLGAFYTFTLGRSLLRSMVRRRMGKRFGVWNKRFKDNAFIWTLYLRLFPLSNATLTSMLAGACKVGLKPYVLANIIGFFPLTLIFAMGGSGAAKGDPSQLIIGIICFVIVILAQWFYTKRLGLKSIKEEESEESPDGKGNEEDPDSA
ncbi:MAG: TVP38/TMEM64 family protein [Candidatus Sumerlaeia bacterium]|nr:TVP38/TMEM64 family protein [Candidatus Sumerlaeia bacterium]